ncbi:hypothetical protein M407DRAFT_22953 [Tulasnella calospora MUT 4182]|uniref:Uncharacterized protein n=1 Tax=Tulasnella calospora MUT 4182 TaxID=1051891 RepID=A0A0C3M256_9AGAM|nr:hypothetical protein M407DRAFT_22953 [Tulasnella calospora MUT 4182]
MPRPNLSSLSLPLAHLLVFSAFAVVHAVTSPFPISSSSALPQRRADPDPQPCGFDGDDDIYGLGIRLGVYLQWLGTMVCSYLEPEEAQDMKSINLGFQASVFGGLLYVTITRGSTQEAGQLHAAEVWVMLSLCTAGILTFGGEPIKRAFVIHGVFQQVLNLAILSYSIWFVFAGMDQMAHPPCSRYAFFFAKVDMYHWHRLLWKISTIPIAIFMGFHLFQCINRLRDQEAEKVEEGKASCGDVSNLARARTWTIWQFFGFGFTIASTELLIQWNHIHNVHSVEGTGQLIPLIVACVGFIRIVHNLFTAAVEELVFYATLP